jgi:hypothetical protein
MSHSRIQAPSLRGPVTLPWLTWVLFAAVLLCAALARAGTEPARYETTAQSVVRIAGDLHQALDPKYRRQVGATPVLAPGAAPLVEPCLQAGATPSVGTVQFSAGLVGLLNYLSHAKAIDGMEGGYYDKSITSLAATRGETGLPLLPASNRKDVAGFDTMNLQVSHFNQMAGALLAIDLAHHYLGHYKKYATQINATPGQPVPIHRLVTAKEWHDAVMAGAKNALGCGLGVDGLKFLLQGFETLPQRPDWTIHLLPPTANVAKACRDLTKLEKDFFLLQ